MENKIPVIYVNHKFPGYIWLTENQYKAVCQRDIYGSNLSMDNYMSLIDPDYPIAFLVLPFIIRVPLFV